MSKHVRKANRRRATITELAAHYHVAWNTMHKRLRGVNLARLSEFIAFIEEMRYANPQAQVGDLVGIQMSQSPFRGKLKLPDLPS